ncbi:hypothetical protein Fot_34180 [Forsythia ovata]|uniref:Uncharacterized protein n=1 Tax=Forsythia ovata TaxID=205694 RepID=A0ABD1SL20_9LAMI
MEELVGVSSCVLGDMASRPNFGLNELDFVFSTLVVGSIMNFVLMYLLAPTISSSSQSLPAIFAKFSYKPHVRARDLQSVEQVRYIRIQRDSVCCRWICCWTCWNCSFEWVANNEEKMDPNFETPNKPPPPVLNAITWAIHMGLSSNFRYQTLNGIEFLLAKGVPPVVFKSSVVVLRCLNNILGGMSFVILARLTGSQSVDQNMAGTIVEGSAEEKEKLVNEAGELQTSEATSK